MLQPGPRRLPSPENRSDKRTESHCARDGWSVRVVLSQEPEPNCSGLGVASNFEVGAGGGVSGHCPRDGRVAPIGNRLCRGLAARRERRPAGFANRRHGGLPVRVTGAVPGGCCPKARSADRRVRESPTGSKGHGFVQGQLHADKAVRAPFGFWATRPSDAPRGPFPVRNGWDGMGGLEYSGFVELSCCPGRCD